MKITQSDFKPITIVIETEEEAQALLSVIDFTDLDKPPIVLEVLQQIGDGFQGVLGY